MDDVSRLPGAGSYGTAAGPGHLDTLTRLCAEEVLSAFGLGDIEHGRLPLMLVARIPARRLARQVAAYDGIVGESGLSAGGVWALGLMSRGVEVEGRESVPREGPLLLVSNHPGLADAVALFAATPRADLRVVAARRPLLEALPNTSRHLIPVSEASPDRFGAVRTATRHMRAGGALLTFPGGEIEPDPAVLPGAAGALERWSGSLDLFMRLVPDLTVVPVVVSGVLSPTALRNPLTLVRRREEDRRWLAATIQMLTPALRNVTTRISFGRPVRAGDLPDRTTREAVLEETRRLIGRCATR